MINYPKVLYNKWGHNILVRFINNLISIYWRKKIFAGSQIEPVIYVDNSIELGQSTHPDLVYDEKNRRYLMTVSNYPYGIERLEDSYVLVSEDGIHFINTNNGPIERYGKYGRSHFSDGDMVFDGNQYSLYYRFCERDQSDAKDIISISSSIDGINWDNGKVIITAEKDKFLSPAVIYYDGHYIMYYVVLTTKGSILYRCNSNLKEFVNYSENIKLMKIYNIPKGMMLWHINISIDGNRLIGLFTLSTGHGGANSRLYYATSKMGSDVWTIEKEIDPMLNMQYIKKIYRAALVKTSDNWYLYQSICLKNDCWFIGRRKFDCI